MDQKSKRKPHRKYDLQFKEAALRQISNGQSVSSVAQSLGISEALLYQWRKKALSAFNPESASGELTMLRKQVKQLEAERDILKKALTIFSRPIKE